MTFEPHPKLKPYVKAYSLVRQDATATPVVDISLMLSASQLRFVLAGACAYQCGNEASMPLPEIALIGPISEPFRITSAGPTLTFIVDLTPRGLALLWSQSAEDIANRVIALDEQAGGLFAQLFEIVSKASSNESRIAATNAVLLQRLAKGAIRHQDRYEKIDALIRRDPVEGITVVEIAAAFGISERQLIRWTRQLYGFRPKLLLRRARFLRAVEAILAKPCASWQDIASVSYYDQSHFCRDFRMFCGITPGQFFWQQRNFIRSDKYLPRAPEKKKRKAQFQQFAEDSRPKAARYEILIGFQLTEQQAAYNVQR
jgi:AraC-like DNA-binding protein